MKVSKGFTLIEIMIVTILMGILVALAMPFLLQSKQKAYDAAVVADLRRAEGLLVTYYMESILSEYPSSPEEAEFEPSPGVVVTRWSVDVQDGEKSVHIHMEHTNSSWYYHATYFSQLDIEKRRK